MTTSRREFLAGLAALGVTGLQVPGGEARRIIDVHQHFASPGYVAVLSRNGGNATPWMKDYTPAKPVEDMDKAGIATAIVSPSPSTVWLKDANEARSVAREMNEFAAAKMVGAYKGRFGVFAALPLPDVDGSLREMEYAFDTLKADGVTLWTSYDKQLVGNEAFAPVFDELNRRKAVVYIHPIQPACCPSLIKGVIPQILEYPTDSARAIMSLIVSDTTTRCPNIKFIFPHGGGTFVSMAGRFVAGLNEGGLLGDPATAPPPAANSRLQQVRRLYWDTGQAANAVNMQALKHLVPVSQILFGGDFPNSSVAAQVAGLRSSGFTAQELRGIYRDNALKILPRFA
jgi:predicted TIM-barrel fold metal-dependent hydrolase